MLTQSIKVPETDVLIATIIRGVPNDNSKDKTEFLTETSYSIQVGVLHRSAGTFIKAHNHLPTRKIVSGCQEVLIVKSGTIEVVIYDHEQNYLATEVLRTGDILIQYHGGHSFSFLVDTQFIEIKQGPYTPADKVFFDPRCHESMK